MRVEQSLIVIANRECSLLSKVIVESHAITVKQPYLCFFTQNLRRGWGLVASAEFCPRGLMWRLQNHGCSGPRFRKDRTFGPLRCASVSNKDSNPSQTTNRC